MSAGMHQPVHTAVHRPSSDAKIKNKAIKIDG